MKLFLFISLIIFLFSGCGGFSMNVEPKSIIHVSGSKLNATIIYDGNVEYLPKNLSYDKSSDFSAKYTYNVKYFKGLVDLDVLNLFNPLVLVGFPLSEESVIAEGNLEVTNRQNLIIKRFKSSCVATMKRSLYQTGGSSDMRKACLLEIRNSMEAQISNFLKEYHENNSVL